jgi:hypothetical protein
MPSERVRQRLFDIRENIGLAREFIRGLAFDEFAADVKTFYATVRALEIVSEAARFLPDDLKARHEDVDWVRCATQGMSIATPTSWSPKSVSGTLSPNASIPWSALSLPNCTGLGSILIGPTALI